MRSTWSTVVRRAAEAVGRRRSGAEEGEEADEAGFTLIELMVVLLIMGILMAIAIPTFLGATKGANDKGAQSNLVNSITSAKTIYAQANTWPVTATMVKQLGSAEPELHFTATKSSNQTNISVSTSTTAGQITTITLATYSAPTHVCWVVHDTAGSGGIEHGFLKATGSSTPTTSTLKCKASTIATTKVKYNTATGGFGISPPGY